MKVTDHDHPIDPERVAHAGPETGDGFDFADDAVARHYDELPLWSAPFGLLLLDRVPVRAGQVVLDVGAGTGFVSIELAQRCGPRSRIVAVDPWPAAMTVLRDKVDYLGLDNLEVSTLDAARTGLPDDSVDVVVSNLGINNFADPTAVLRECRRVLRPGGRMLVTTNLVGHMAEFYEEFEAALRACGRADRLAALRADVDHRATVAGMQASFGAAGLSVRGVTESSFRMRFSGGAALLDHHFIRLGFRPQWAAVIGPVDPDRVWTELTRRLDRRAAVDGELTLTVPVALIDAE